MVAAESGEGFHPEGGPDTCRFGCRGPQPALVEHMQENIEIPGKGCPLLCGTH